MRKRLTADGVRARLTRHLDDIPVPDLLPEAQRRSRLPELVALADGRPHVRAPRRERHRRAAVILVTAVALLAIVASIAIRGLDAGGGGTDGVVAGPASPTSWRADRVTGLPSGRQAVSLAITAERVWVASIDGSLLAVQRATLTVERSTVSGVVAVAADATTAWALTQGGAVVELGPTPRTLTVLDGTAAPVTAADTVLAPTADSVWVATAEGLARVDRRDGTTTIDRSVGPLVSVATAAGRVVASSADRATAVLVDVRSGSSSVTIAVPEVRRLAPGAGVILGLGASGGGYITIDAEGRVSPVRGCCLVDERLDVVASHIVALRRGYADIYDGLSGEQLALVRYPAGVHPSASTVAGDELWLVAEDAGMSELIAIRPDR